MPLPGRQVLRLDALSKGEYTLFDPLIRVHRHDADERATQGAVREKLRLEHIHERRSTGQDQVLNDVSNPEQAVLVRCRHNLEKSPPGELWIRLDEAPEFGPFAIAAIDVRSERSSCFPHASRLRDLPLPERKCHMTSDGSAGRLPSQGSSANAAMKKVGLMFISADGGGRSDDSEISAAATWVSATAHRRTNATPSDTTAMAR